MLQISRGAFPLRLLLGSEHHEHRGEPSEGFQELLNLEVDYASVMLSEGRFCSMKTHAIESEGFHHHSGQGPLFALAACHMIGP